MATPPYTTPIIPDAVRLADKDVGPTARAAWSTSWRPANRRLFQLALDSSTVLTIVLTFARVGVPAEVMFHVVFVLLTVHAFFFGLRGTLFRIGIVSVPLLAYANARLLGWSEPAFDLTEWPLMFVIAVMVAWMADRRDATARRYAGLFRQASERLLTVEEDERRRIALELHDGVGQVLTALTLTLDAGRPSPGTGDGQAIGAARTLAESALAEVRHLAHRMRPARIEERGLVAAIRDLAGQSGFPVRVHLDPGDHPLPLLESYVTVGVYRIVQEALANAARHSGAPMANVWISAQNRHLNVQVVDEGSGFDPSTAVEPGIGVAGMYERARLMGGQLTIRSAKGTGTRINLDLPLPPTAR